MAGGEAAIHDPVEVARVLGAMGLSAAVLELAASRAPPVGGGVVDVDEVPRSEGGKVP